MERDSDTGFEPKFETTLEAEAETALEVDGAFRLAQLDTAVGGDIIEIDGIYYSVVDGLLIPLSDLAGDVEDIDPEAGNETDPGTTPLSGGASNDSFALGDIGEGIGLTSLLPPTALAFGRVREEDVQPFIEDDEPSLRVAVTDPDPTAGVEPDDGDDPVEPLVDSDPSDRVVNVTLYERFFEGGTAEGDGPTVVTGILEVDTGRDGFGSLVIDGVDVSDGGSVDGSYGTLTLAPNEDGTYSYTFSPDGAIDHSDEGVLSDSFDVVLTDADGDSVSGAIVVNIADDGPIARDDVVSGTVSDEILEGDLSINDENGADGSRITSVGGQDLSDDGVSVESEFGVLSVGPDGGYSFAVDTDHPELVALPGGETLTLEFPYVRTDSDGDTSEAVLTLTLRGVDDPVVISGLGSSEPDATVDEADLATGGSAADTQTFAVDTPDGLDTVTVGGVEVVTDGEFIGPVTIPSEYGTVTITGFSPVTLDDGTVTAASFTYSYEITAPTSDHDQTGRDSVSEQLDVVVTDSDGSSSTAVMDLSVVDDVPAATDDGPVTVVEGGSAVSGNVTDNDDEGADGATVTAIDYVGATYSPGEAIDTEFGTIVFAADGSYEYTPGASVPDGAVERLSYTLTDSDGDVVTASLEFNYSGDANIPTATGASAVVDEDDLEGGLGDQAPGDDDPAASGTLGADFGLDGAGTILLSGMESVTINGAIYGATVSDDGLTLTVSDGNGDIARVTLADDSSGRYSVELLAPVAHADPDLEDDVAFDIDYVVTDADGSTSAGTLRLSIDDDRPVLEDMDVSSPGENLPITVDISAVLTEGADGVDLSDDASATATLTQGSGSLTDNGDGTFTYVPAPGESGDVTLSVTVVDADGDTAQSDVTLRLGPDSMPVIQPAGVTVVDEDGLPGANADDTPPDSDETTSTGSATANGTLRADFGADSPDDLLAAFSFADDDDALAALGAQGLTSQGDALVWSVSDDGLTLTGSDGTSDIVVIIVTGASQSAAGVTYDYTVTLDGALDHPAGDLEDAISLTGIGFSVEDADGSVSDGSFDVGFVDDVPTANDDSFNATETGADGAGSTTLGNVLDNDATGADGATVALIGDGAGSHGSLSLNADGSFEYVPVASVPAGTVETFTYLITDGDGDTDTAVITFTFVGDRNAPVAGTTRMLADDDGLAGGNPDSGGTDDLDANAGDASGGTEALYSTSLQVDYGADGAGSASFANLDGQTMSVGQDDVTLSWDDANSVLTATISGGARDGTDLFTLTLTETGTPGAYDIALEILTPVLHDQADNGERGDLVLDLAYETTDADGTVQGGNTLSLLFDDDAPSLVAGPSLAQGAEDQSVVFDLNDFVAEGADGVVAFTAGLVSSAGTLTDLGGGRFRFDPEPGQSIDPVVTFTATDADGDVVSGEFDIALQPDSAPVVFVPDGETVLEAGMVGGSQAGDGSDSTQGVFTIDTVGDALDQLLINGTAVSDGDTVSGTYGTLSVNFDGTEWSWTYQLETPADHGDPTQTGLADAVEDSFTVAVIDSDGSVSPDADLTIGIGDDGPTARDDSNSVAEDGVQVATGNVILDPGTGQDTTGADGAQISGFSYDGVDYMPGDTVQTDYGQITILADGSYTFQLDNANGDVQALSSGDSLLEQITYTLTDSDEDSDSAVLSITILGSDDLPTVDGGVGVVVDEANLPDPGSAPDPGALVQSDSFTVSAADGLDTVVLGGVTLVEDGVLVGGTLTVPTEDFGTVVITGYTPVTAPDGTVIGGTFDYDYTLTDNADHGGAGQDISRPADLVIDVTDSDGSTASGTLAITVVDDVPTAVDDGPVQTVEGGPDVTGNVITDAPGADSVGADGAQVSAVLFDGVSYGPGDTITTPNGVMVIAADGSYSYSPNASVADGTTDAFTYTLTDSDGDADTAELLIEFSGDANIPAATGAAALVDEDDLSGIGNNDSAPGDDDPSISGTLGADFGLDGVGSILFGDTADVVLNGVTYVATTSSDGLTITLNDGSQDVLRVTLSDDVSGDYGVELLAPLTHADPAREDDVDFDLTYVVTDGDGSQVEGVLRVTVDDDMPVANDIFVQQTGENNPITVDVLRHVDGGADGFNPAEITAVLTLGTGTLSNNGDGTFTYVPTSGETGVVTFDYSVVDADGDTVTETVTITLVGDSEPQIMVGAPAIADEDGLSSANADSDPLETGEVDAGAMASATSTLTVNYGFDAPVDPLAAFALSDDPADLLGLDSQGLATENGPIVWSVSADGLTLTGNDGAQDVVTLTVDGATEVAPGVIEYSYTVDLAAPLLHGVSTLEDTISLSGIAFGVTDADGDSASGTFEVGFVDDVPTAQDDSFAATEAGTLDPTAMTVGNVLDNDQLGADFAGAAVSLVGSATGTHGTLALAADGSFTYTPNGSVAAGETDSFTYVLTDGDGDVSTATITFTFSGDNNIPAEQISTAAVDDDGLPGGNPDSDVPDDLDANLGDADGPLSSEASFTGALAVDYGGDGAGTADFSNLHMTSMAVGQEMVELSWDAGTGQLAATITTGDRAGSVLFTVALTPGATAGEYDYAITLQQPVIHPEGPDGEANDLALDLAYSTTDSDGSTEMGNILRVTFDDDAPTAQSGSASQTVEDGSVVIDIAALIAGGADGVLPSDITAEIAGAPSTPGTLSDNGDGTFTFTPVPGQDGNVAIAFTATDGDGDMVSAEVEVTLLPDSPASISFEGATVVGEAGLTASTGNLDGGSNAGDGSDSTAGTLSIDTGNDTIGSVVVDGIDVTNGGTVIGEYGDLVVTVTGGAYSWTYTLRDNTLDHGAADSVGGDDTVGDDFTVTLTDSDGSSDTDTLSISIEDDGPTAVDDVASITEDAAPNTVTGNVVSDAPGADTLGADGAEVESLVFDGTTYAPGDVISTPYGTLSVDADGDYVFTLDDANADVQALSPGDAPLTVELAYVLADAETMADTSTATLTILILGADDGVTITGLDPDNAEITVDEDDLPGGTDGSDPLTRGNDFTVDAPDGLDAVTIGGTTVYVNGALTGAVVDTPLGELTVTGFTPVTAPNGTVIGGTFTYSYTLQTSADNDPGQGEAPATETLDLVVTDTDGSSDTGTIDIDIVDDVPETQDDANSVTEDGPLTASGNVVTDTAGADLTGADGAAVTEVAFGTTTVVVDSATGATITLDYGTLTLAADGSYSYTLDNTDPRVQLLDPNDPPLVETVTYTLLDGDGDPQTADLVITINGADDAVSIGGIDAGAPEIALDEDDLPGGSDGTGPLAQTESFTVDAPDGLGTISLGGQTLFSGGAFTGTNLVLQTDHGEVLITGFTNVTTVDGVITGGEVTYQYTLTDAQDHPDGAGENINTETLALVVTDLDNDSATSEIDIEITDDVPDAVDQPDVTTTEGAAASTGNVITDAVGADVPGADGASLTAVMHDGTAYSFTAGDPVTITTANGVLVIAADGGYSYTPNASVAAGESDSFTYTLTDGDLDSDTATLTIQFAGDVNVPLAGTDAATVDEDDLAGIGVGDTAQPGDDAADASGTLPGTFGLDGAGSILFGATADSTINGVTYSFTTSADGLSVTVNDGTQDVMEVTLSDSTSGNYTVTLLAPLTHADPLSEDDVVFNLSYLVADSDTAPGSEATGTLSVSVDDDRAVLGSAEAGGESLTVPNDDTVTPQTGTFETFDFGADGAHPTEAVSITGPVLDGILYDAVSVNADGTYTLTGYADDGGSLGDPIFSFTVDPATGVYTFDLIEAESASQEVLDLGALAPGSTSFTELDTGTVEFTAAVNGDDPFTTDGAPVNVSTAGFAPDGQWFDPGEGTRLEFFTNSVAGVDDDPANVPASQLDLIDSITLDVDAQGGPNAINSVEITFTAYDTTDPNNVISETITLTVTPGVGLADGQVTFDPSIQFNVLVIENVSSGSLFRLLNPTIGRTILPEDVQLDFGVSLTDADGDTTQVETVSVTIDAATSGGSTMAQPMPVQSSTGLVQLDDSAVPGVGDVAALEQRAGSTWLSDDFASLAFGGLVTKPVSDPIAEHPGQPTLSLDADLHPGPTGAGVEPVKTQSDPIAENPGVVSVETLFGNSVVTVDVDPDGLTAVDVLDSDPDAVRTETRAESGAATAQLAAMMIGLAAMDDAALTWGLFDPPDGDASRPVAGDALRASLDSDQSDNSAWVETIADGLTPGRDMETEWLELSASKPSLDPIAERPGFGLEATERALEPLAVTESGPELTVDQAAASWGQPEFVSDDLSALEALGLFDSGATTLEALLDGAVGSAPTAGEKGLPTVIAEQPDTSTTDTVSLPTPRIDGGALGTDDHLGSLLDDMGTQALMMAGF